MKKFIALLLALLLVVSFAACKTTDNTNDTDSTTDSSTVTNESESTTESGTESETDADTGNADATDKGEIDFNKPFRVSVNLALSLPFANNGDDYVDIDDNYTNDDYMFDVDYYEVEDEEDEDVVDITWETRTFEMVLAYQSLDQFSLVADIPFSGPVSLALVNDVVYASFAGQKFGVNLSDESLSALLENIQNSIPAELMEAYAPIVNSVLSLFSSLDDGVLTEEDFQGLLDVITPYIEDFIANSGMGDLSEEEQAFVNTTADLLKKMLSGEATEDDLKAYAPALVAFLEPRGVVLDEQDVTNAIDLISKVVSGNLDVDAFIDEASSAFVEIANKNGAELAEEDVAALTAMAKDYIARFVALFEDVTFSDLIGFDQGTDADGNMTMEIRGVTDVAMNKVSAILDLVSELVVELYGNESSAMPEEFKQNILDMLDRVSEDRLSVALTVGTNSFAVTGSYALNEETTITESVTIEWTTENVVVTAPADADEYTVMTLVEFIAYFMSSSAPEENYPEFDDNYDEDFDYDYDYDEDFDYDYDEDFDYDYDYDEDYDFGFDYDEDVEFDYDFDEVA